MKICLLNFIGDVLRAVAEWCDEGADLFRRCPTCGENPYTGKPCR